MTIYDKYGNEMFRGPYNSGEDKKTISREQSELYKTSDLQEIKKCVEKSSLNKTVVNRVYGTQS